MSPNEVEILTLERRLIRLDGDLRAKKKRLIGVLQNIRMLDDLYESACIVTLIFVVTDSATGNPIAGAAVDVYGSSGLVASGVTNGAGSLTVALPAVDTYTASVADSGYTTVFPTMPTVACNLLYLIPVSLTAIPVIQSCNSGSWPSTIYLRTNGGTKYPLAFGSSNTVPTSISLGAGWLSSIQTLPVGSFPYPGRAAATSCTTPLTTIPFYFFVRCVGSTLSVAMLLSGGFTFCSMCYFDNLTFSTFDAFQIGSTITSLTNSPLSASGTWLSTALNATHCPLPANPFAGQGWTLLPI